LGRTEGRPAGRGGKEGVEEEGEARR
jgi:hypothetical protein